MILAARGQALRSMVYLPRPALQAQPQRRRESWRLMQPNDSAVHNDEVVQIDGEAADWYRLQMTNNGSVSSAWHRLFHFAVELWRGSTDVTLSLLWKRRKFQLQDV